MSGYLSTSRRFHSTLSGVRILGVVSAQSAAEQLLGIAISKTSSASPGLRDSAKSRYKYAAGRSTRLTRDGSTLLYMKMIYDGECRKCGAYERVSQQATQCITGHDEPAKTICSCECGNQITLTPFLYSVRNISVLGASSEVRARLPADTQRESTRVLKAIIRSRGGVPAGTVSALQVKPEVEGEESWMYRLDCVIVGPVVSVPRRR